MLTYWWWVQVFRNLPHMLTIFQFLTFISPLFNSNQAHSLIWGTLDQKYRSKLSTLKHDYFWKCGLWGTIYNFFLFHRKSCSVLDINFYILDHFINFENCEVMMSISTQGRVHFWVHLLTLKLLGHETGPTNRYHHFSGKCFHDLEDWVLNQGPFLFTNLPVNRKLILMSL